MPPPWVATDLRAARARLGDLEACKRHLADGVDVNIRGHYKYTALCMAAKKHTAVVELLIENGADVDAHDMSGFGPMHWACQHGNATAVNLLMKAGADFDKPNRGKYTPFLLAVHWGHGRIAKTLIDAGADCAAKTMMGMTALKMVQTTGREKKHYYDGIKLRAILEEKAPGTGCPPWPPEPIEVTAKRQLEYEAGFEKRREEYLAKMAAQKAAAQAAVPVS